MPRDQNKPGSLIYGPVPSRRLGRSLGVDIVPYKTCTYDCIYCQIGRTPETTLVRQPYISADRIIAELKTRLDAGVEPDFLTVGGSGEPCLNSDIKTIIGQIKALSNFPVAVLTNGSLLWDPEVQDALLAADVVLPSLDAFDEKTFARLNRPHADISFERMVQGLADFRKKYTGRIWLEIFIVSGINDSEAAMAAFQPHIQAICPDRIHLNTAVRPPAEKSVGLVGPERLQRLASALDRRAEVVAEFSHAHTGGVQKGMETEILDMLQRRPCTAADIADGLGIEQDAVMGKISGLTAEGRLEIRESNGKTYYFRPSDNENERQTT